MIFLNICVSSRLKISFDGEEELLDENPLECGNTVLLTEHQHRFLVVDRIYTAKRNRDKYSIFFSQNRANLSRFLPVFSLFCPDSRSYTLIRYSDRYTETAYRNLDFA